MQESLGDAETVAEHQREMGGPDLQSMLDEMREEREGKANSIKNLPILMRAVKSTIL